MDGATPRSWEDRLDIAIERVLESPGAFHAQMFSPYANPGAGAMGNFHAQFAHATSKVRSEPASVRNEPWRRALEMGRRLAEEHGYVGLYLALIAELFVHKRPPPAEVVQWMQSAVDTVPDKLRTGAYPKLRGTGRRATARMAQSLSGCMRYGDKPHRLVYGWLGNLRAEGPRSRRRRATAAVLIPVITVLTILIFDIRPEDFRRLGNFDTRALNPLYWSWIDAWLAPPESPPPAGENLMLSEAEARYCVHQAARLDIMRELPYAAAVQADLGLAIADFNRRCGRFAYDAAALTVLEEQAAARFGRLRAEAERELAEWRKNASVRRPPPVDLDDIATGVKRLDPARREDARLIQERLTDLGFELGKIDGIWGKASRAALVAFKQARGIGFSRTWDTATQRHLFGPPPEASN